MTTSWADHAGFELVGYEAFTEHGFALPCFGEGPRANSVYVAQPTLPGDPQTTVASFELHEAEDIRWLPPAMAGRRVRTGDPWLDVFLWKGAVYVGTKTEIWRATSTVRNSIKVEAPLSLLTLGEGASGVQLGRLAKWAYAWLLERHGPTTASDWQSQVFIRGLTLRGLRRSLGGRADSGPDRSRLQRTTVSLDGTTVFVHLPWRRTDISPFAMSDLFSIHSGAAAFDLRTRIVYRDAPVQPSYTSPRTGGTLLMRLRRGRDGTQTQIPFETLDEFFDGELLVRAKSSGTLRKMTLSSSKGRRNTMKLHLPEMKNMSDPLARFECGADGFSYELHDADTQQGGMIKDMLERGLPGGETRQTRGSSTLWRIV